MPHLDESHIHFIVVVMDELKEEFWVLIVVDVRC